MGLKAVEMFTGEGRGAPRVNLKDDARYVREVDRIEALKGRLAVLESRRSALLNFFLEDRRDDVSQRARALLEGGDIARSQELAQTEARSELDRVMDELAIVRKAIELHSPVVEAARWRACGEINRQLLPAHRAIVRKVSAALEALDAALGEEKAFRDRLEDAGVSLVEIRPMGVAMLGRLDDPQSYASHWAREAREYLD